MGLKSVSHPPQMYGPGEISASLVSLSLFVIMGTPQGKIFVRIKREKARKQPGTQVLNLAFSLHFLFHKSSLFKKEKVCINKQMPLECSPPPGLGEDLNPQRQADNTE